MTFNASEAGELFDRKALLLAQHVGTAEGGDGEKYSMSLVNMHIPAVRCERTGKTFVLGWQDVIALAVDRGIKEG